MRMRRTIVHSSKAAYGKAALIRGCSQRGWSLCEIINQAGAGFYQPGQQRRILFPVEAGQDDYIKEIYQTLRICIQVQFSQRYGQIKDRRPKFFLNIFCLA